MQSQYSNYPSWTQEIDGVTLQSPNPLHHDPAQILAVSPFGWVGGTQEFHKVYTNMTCSCSAWKHSGGCVHTAALSRLVADGKAPIKGLETNSL